MAAQIPAWMFLTYMGTKGAGGFLSSMGASEEKEKDRKMQREQWLEKLEMENRQLNMNDEHFRAQMRANEDQAKSQGPANLVNMLSSIGSLRKSPAGTSDILKAFL